MLNSKPQKMKTLFTLFLTIAFTAILVFSSTAQTPADALKHGTSVTFFGVDYSKCKGVVLGATSEEMRDKVFPAINMLLVVEQDKYDVKKALMKSEVIIDLNDVNRINATIDASKFEVYSSKELKPFIKDTIAQMIQLYNLKDKTGIGLVFIAEYLDKPGTTAAYNLVYFSMPDGKVILLEREFGTPKGFGMRNYWAYTIYDILKSGIQQKLEMKYLPKKKK
jgi:hypothetical protein